jgi:hypothetical protein
MSYSLLSESPCIDGTILNMDQAGCESFYWGPRDHGIVLKITCTDADVQSFWTNTDFYATPHRYELANADLRAYCVDRYTNIYALPRGAQFRASSKEQ